MSKLLNIYINLENYFRDHPEAPFRIRLMIDGRKSENLTNEELLNLTAEDLEDLNQLGRELEGIEHISRVEKKLEELQQLQLQLNNPEKTIKIVRVLVNSWQNNAVYRLDKQNIASFTDVVFPALQLLLEENKIRLFKRNGEVDTEYGEHDVDNKGNKVKLGAEGIDRSFKDKDSCRFDPRKHMVMIANLQPSMTKFKEEGGPTDGFQHNPEFGFYIVDKQTPILPESRGLTRYDFNFNFSAKGFAEAGHYFECITCLLDDEEWPSDDKRRNSSLFEYLSESGPSTSSLTTGLGSMDLIGQPGSFRTTPSVGTSFDLRTRSKSLAPGAAILPEFHPGIPSERMPERRKSDVKIPHPTTQSPCQEYLLSRNPHGFYRQGVAGHSECSKGPDTAGEEVDEKLKTDFLNPESQFRN